MSSFCFSRSDMTAYMGAVFSLLFQIAPELSDAAGCDPDALAARTASHAFRSMALKDGEMMSFAQYKVWYLSEDNSSRSLSGDAAADSQGNSEESEDSEQSEESDGEDDEYYAELDIFQVQHLLGLHQVAASSIAVYFARISDEYGRIDEDTYNTAFDMLMTQGYGGLSAEAQPLVEEIKERIFSVYEIAESGMLSCRSLTSGMSLFCGGSWEDKAAAVFIAYGVQDVMPPDVMTQHIISIFAMMSEFDPTFLSDSTAVQIAEDMVRVAFSDQQRSAGQRSRGMTQAEFALWLSTGSDGISASSDDQGAAVSSSGRGLTKSEIVPLMVTSDEEPNESDGEEDNSSGEGQSEEAFGDEEGGEEINAIIGVERKNQVQTQLAASKRLLCLHMFTADDLLEVVGEFAKEGILSRSAWYDAIGHMLTLGGTIGDSFSSSYRLAGEIFDSIDTPGLEAVDYSSIVIGLSPFCNSPIEDRVMVAFTLLDDVHDGEVDFDELLRYFRTIYATMRVLSPSLQELMTDLGESSDTLAEALLRSCLDELKFTEYNQNYFTLENVIEIAEYCLELEF